jgi:hypothetical protein
MVPLDTGAIFAYLPTVRKVKLNAAAVAMARKRWKGYSAEERRDQLRKAWKARSAAAAARRAARLAATEEPEEVSA